MNTSEFAGSIIHRVFNPAKQVPPFNPEKPLVVGFFAVHSGIPILQHFAVLSGHASDVNVDLIFRKAAVAARTGRDIPEAIAAADNMGLDLLDWVPNGTKFRGAAPVKDPNGVVHAVWAVSGQDQDKFDQHLAYELAEESEKDLHLAGLGA